MKRVAAVIGLASLILSACASESSTATANIEGALRVRRFSALPVCWFGERGTVYFVEDTELFYYCDGRNYVALDLQGLDGSDGVSWVVNVDEAPADLCPAGGALISAGPDVDGDGAADEVTSSQPVCDGIDGQDGMDGQDGTDGRDGAQGPPGDDGMDGADGTDGADGADGMDGGSCSVSTDQSGTVTIACDDGTVATIPPGGGSGGTGGGTGGSGGSGGGTGGAGGDPTGESCPCYAEADLLASSATGCRRIGQRREREDDPKFLLRDDLVTTTLPITRTNPGASCPSPLVTCPVLIEDVGDFVSREYFTEFEVFPPGGGDAPTILDYEEFSCDGPGENSRIVSDGEFAACEAAIISAFGTCSSCGDGNTDTGFEECDDGGSSTFCNRFCQFRECFENSDCDDGNVCTSTRCDTFDNDCIVTFLDGERCVTPRLGETGQCVRGNCLPLSGGL